MLGGAFSTRVILTVAVASVVRLSNKGKGIS